MSLKTLLLIDVQQGFDDPSWGNRNNPEAEDNIAKLLAHWREQGWPIVHVRHSSTEPLSPLRPDLPGYAFHQKAMPLDSEATFSKSVNSAFIGTGLEDYLKERGLFELVVAGLTTDHCVSTSVRMAANLGFDVTLVEDACATFDKTAPDHTPIDAETLHKVHLTSLNGEFCQLAVTHQLLEKD